MLRLLDECDRLSGDPSGADRGSVVSRLCGETSAHAQIQKEVLVPALRDAADERAGGAQDDRLAQVLATQARSGQLAAEVGLLQPGDADFDAKVTALANAIREQIRIERDELLPLAREAGLDLEALGTRMDQRKTELIPPSQAD